MFFLFLNKMCILFCWFHLLFNCFYNKLILVLKIDKKYMMYTERDSKIESRELIRQPKSDFRIMFGRRLL